LVATRLSTTALPGDAPICDRGMRG
jgi:hypothetical protein